MKKIMMIVMVATIVANSAHADLGDTIASSEAKYGSGVRDMSHDIIYNHNGYRITEVFNDSEVCVSIDFARLDGKPISVKVMQHLDITNLPPYVLNPTGSGWIIQTCPDNTNIVNAHTFTWKTSYEMWQVLRGQFRYGSGTNATPWYWGVSYTTPAGFKMIQQENAEYDQQQQKQTVSEASPDSALNVGDNWKQCQSLA